MANILFLPHRLPYPPNKGDKVRSYHMLKYLLQYHKVYLGSFIDDPVDEQYLPIVSEWCHQIHVEKLDPLAGKIKSLRGLLTGVPLTLPYYYSASMAAWIDHTIRTQAIDAVVVFSSAMAQYVLHQPTKLLVDFVDVDSDKWVQYAQRKSWPMSWVYRREGRTLLDFEVQVAQRAEASFLTTEQEVALFRRLMRDSRPVVESLNNGVDADFFAPDTVSTNPYRADEWPVVFTGAMDYWPNVDAVTWFAREVLPQLRAQEPRIRFYIVGMRPTPDVQALACEHIVVTGTVPDVRPYLAAAKVVVAPLRIARGIQNKVLEAMAMARPVVVSQTCAAPINAVPGVHLATADSPEEYQQKVLALLRQDEQAQEMGRQARERVLSQYSWHAHMSRLAHYLA